MKSQERMQKERDSNSTLYAVIGICAVILFLIGLLWMGISGASINIVVSKIIAILMNIWNEIAFKFSQFFGFLAA